MSIAANLSAVQNRISAACGRSRRTASSVRLVAVTKYAPIEAVRELIDLGHRDLGESRPQQLIERAALLADANPCWHLIGPLQRNKARKVLPTVALIHSVDSVRLIETLNRLAIELELRPRVLLEVNVSGEASKQGFSPESLRSAWPTISTVKAIEIAGLMTMAPYADDPETARPVFRKLRELRDELASRTLPLSELSMGMSGDFEVAIEEGATIVRVGSSLFEEP